MRYFEPDSISRLTNHLHEYGFAFTKTDAESAGENVLPPDKTRVTISRLKLTEKEATLRPQIKHFIQQAGLNLSEDPLIDMFIKGMSLSDEGHLFTFGGDQIRFSESDALKNKRKQVVKAKKAAQRQQYQKRCTEIVTNIMKKREKTDE